MDVLIEVSNTQLARDSCKFKPDWGKGAPKTTYGKIPTP